MNAEIVIEFLSELQQNNNRDWFQSNKEYYLEAKNEVETFVNHLIPALMKIDKTILPLTAKECMFRIYKDIRFSTDKSPYKINFGAYIARGGRKSIFPGYYVHFENDNSFLSGGIYMPQPEVLKAIRKEIFENIDEFKSIIQNESFKKYFGAMDDESKLSRAPKDFPADFPDIDLLKFKNYFCIHPVKNKLVSSDKYLEYAINIFKAMLPLNKFLNEAIEKMLESKGDEEIIL